MQKTQLLYHYCSEETFKSIIVSKTLWLTKIIKSNDYEEVLRTYDIIWPQIYNQLLLRFDGNTDKIRLLEQINQQIQIDKKDSPDEQMNPFGVCFTVNRDLAQNWNEYGDKSKGLAIGFSEELLYGIKHDMPHPNAVVDNSIGWNQVYYDREDLTPLFVDLFAQVLEQDPMAFLTIPSTLRHYRSFIKNPTFQDEREVRIIYYPLERKDNSSTCGISEIKNNVVTHCELPWLKNNNCPIKEIIVGTNCNLSVDDVKRILKENGINYSISIVKSDYPYRLSQNRTNKKTVWEKNFSWIKRA